MHVDHRHRYARCLLWAEIPQLHRRQVDLEESVGVNLRLRPGARNPGLDDLLRLGTRDAFEKGADCACLVALLVSAGDRPRSP